MLILLAAIAAHAHDLWLVPQTCTPTAGEPVALELQLGSAGVPEERRGMEAPRVVRYDLISGPRTVPLPPALDRAPLPAGADALVVLDRTPAHADLPPDRFAHYISEEQHAAAAGATGGAEDYTRHLKLLLGASGDSWGRVTGQAYEIVLLDDPRGLPSGAPLRTRVLLRGAPAAGVRVQALGGIPAFGSIVPAGPVKVTEGRTNAAGELTLPLPGAGLVLLRSVHLEACTGCSAAAWRSWWAAYTFCAGVSPPK